jgi:hypothetical protein
MDAGHMTRRIAVFFSTFSAISCSAVMMNMQSVDSSVRIRDLPKSREVILPALIWYCGDRGFTLSMTDATEGTIETSFQENAHLLSQTVRRRYRSRIVFNVQDLPGDSSRVTSNIYIDEEDLNGMWSTVAVHPTVAKRVYDLMYSAIEERMR